MSIMRSPARTQDASGDSIRIVTGYNYATINFGGDAYSGVRFSSDGNMYAFQKAGGVTVIGSWLVSGTNSDYYIVSTVDAGSLTTDPGRGPLQLNATRDFNCIDTSYTGGAVTAVVSFTIEDVATTDFAGPTGLSFSATSETDA